MVVGNDFLGLKSVEIWLRDTWMILYAIPNSATLPWGEGEPFSPQGTFQTQRVSTARCALCPLPEGEGQGEGKRGGLPSLVSDYSRQSRASRPPAKLEVSLDHSEIMRSRLCFRWNLSCASGRIGPDSVLAFPHKWG